MGASFSSEKSPLDKDTHARKAKGGEGDSGAWALSQAPDI